jgi:hypothetical protein
MRISSRTREVLRLPWVNGGDAMWETFRNLMSANAIRSNHLWGRCRQKD